MKRSTGLIGVTDVLMALAGVLLILFITNKGPGVTPDSVNYLDAALNLATGNGLKALMPNGNIEPFTHYPPLFPMILALFRLARIDPVSAARWLNALLFGANIFVAGLLVKRTYGNSLSAFVASALILCCPALIYVHSMIWTEPLFILLAVIGLFLLSKFMATRRSRDLTFSAMCIGLAFLCRYSGMSLIVTALVAFIFIRYDNKTQRIHHVILFLSVGLAPSIYWMFRNALTAGTATERIGVFHPMALSDMKLDPYMLSDWILPSTMPDGMGAALLLAIFFGVILINLLYMRNEKVGNERPLLSLVLAIFVLVYVAFIIVSRSFFDAAIPIDNRIFSPVVVALIILSSGLALRRLVDRVPAAAFLILFILVFCDYHAWSGERKLKRDWMGYASDVWRRSKTITAVRRLPSNIPIYTNGPEAILYLTGKRSRRIPEKSNPFTLRQNIRYEQQMDLLNRNLKINGGYVVYLRRLIQWRNYIPSEEAVKRELNIQIVSEATDGAIYRSPLSNLP